VHYPRWVQAVAGHIHMLIGMHVISGSFSAVCLSTSHCRVLGAAGPSHSLLSHMHILTIILLLMLAAKCFVG
jgi:hypothetical protein